MAKRQAAKSKTKMTYYFGKTRTDGDGPRGGDPLDRRSGVPSREPRHDRGRAEDVAEGGGLEDQDRLQGARQGGSRAAATASRGGGASTRRGNPEGA